MSATLPDPYFTPPTPENVEISVLDTESDAQALADKIESVYNPPAPTYVSTTHASHKLGRIVDRALQGEVFYFGRRGVPLVKLERI